MVIQLNQEDTFWLPKTSPLERSIQSIPIIICFGNFRAAPLSTGGCYGCCSTKHNSMSEQTPYPCCLPSHDCIPSPPFLQCRKLKVSGSPAEGQTGRSLVSHCPSADVLLGDWLLRLKRTSKFEVCCCLFSCGIARKCSFKFSAT